MPFTFVLVTHACMQDVCCSACLHCCCCLCYLTVSHPWSETVGPAWPNPWAQFGETCWNQAKSTRTTCCILGIPSPSGGKQFPLRKDVGPRSRFALSIKQFVPACNTTAGKVGLCPVTDYSCLICTSRSIRLTMVGEGCSAPQGFLKDSASGSRWSGVLTRLSSLTGWIADSRSR